MPSISIIARISEKYHMMKAQNGKFDELRMHFIIKLYIP